MRTCTLVLFFFLFAAAASGGCGDDGRPVPDSGVAVDGSVEAGSDAGDATVSDTGTMDDGSSPDASPPDAALDATSDGTIDDAALDATPDGTTSDATLDATPDADACALITHYADCDGDGYPAAGAETTMACATPSTPPSSCPSGVGGATWTEYGTWTDCNDDDAGVNPGVSGWRTVPISGADPAVDYDYDCDGVEEQRWTAIGGCVPSGSSTGSACTLTEGWETSVPDCGVTGFYIDSCAMSPGPGGVWECNARGSTVAASCK